MVAQPLPFSVGANPNIVLLWLLDEPSWRVPVLGGTIFVEKYQMVRPSSGFFIEFIVGAGTFST